MRAPIVRSSTSKADPTATEESTGEGALGCSQDLLDNPSFERWASDGAPEGWTLANAADLGAATATITPDDVQPLSGQQSARIVVDGEDAVVLLQRVDMPYPAGTRLAARFGVRWAPVADTFPPTMLLWGAINDIHELVASSVEGDGEEDWREIEGEFILIDDAPFLNVWLELPAGTYVVDDVTLRLCEP